MNVVLPNLEQVQKAVGTTHAHSFFQATEKFLTHKFQLKPLELASYSVHQHSLIKKIGFYFFTITGLIKHALGSFLFGLNLFSLIQGLSQILLNILTISYSLLDSFFFLAFEIKLLQKNLLPHQENKDILSEQIRQVSVIYKQLLNIELLNCLSVDEYIELQKLSECFLQHLTVEQQQLKTRLNTPNSKFLSYFLIGLGGISKLSSNYFFCQTFLKTFLPQLVSSLLGTIFTASIIIGSMGLYFSVNGTGIYQYMHAETKTLHQLEREMPKLQVYAKQLRENYPKTLKLFHSLKHISPKRDLSFDKSP